MGGKKKILIVDDEVGIVDELKEFLAEEGYEVFVSDIEKLGIELIDQKKPDILMVDMKLPDMSGVDVLRACKEKLPSVKTIVITGYVDQSAIDEAEKLGRDVFLQKPFDLIRVAEEIERLLK